MKIIEVIPSGKDGSRARHFEKVIASLVRTGFVNRRALPRRASEVEAEAIIEKATKTGEGECS